VCVPALAQWEDVDVSWEQPQGESGFAVSGGWA
jgi:hypothetical protein